MDIELPDIEDIQLKDTSGMLDSYEAGGNEDTNWWDVGQVQTQQGGRGFWQGVQKGTEDSLVLPAAFQRDKSLQDQRIQGMQEKNTNYNTGLMGGTGQFVGEAATLLPAWGAAAKIGSSAVRGAGSIAKSIGNRKAIQENLTAMDRLAGRAYGPMEASLPINNGARINALETANKKLSFDAPKTVFGENLAQETVATPMGIGYDAMRSQVEDNGESFNPYASAAMNLGGGLAFGYPMAKFANRKVVKAAVDETEALSGAREAIDKGKDLRFDSEYVTRKIDANQGKQYTDENGVDWLDLKATRVPIKKNKHGIATFNPKDIEVRDARTDEYISFEEAKRTGQASDSDLDYIVNSLNGGAKGKKKPSETQPDIKDLKNQNLKFMENYDLAELKTQLDADKARYDAAAARHKENPSRETASEFAAAQKEYEWSKSDYDEALSAEKRKTINEEYKGDEDFGEGVDFNPNRELDKYDNQGNGKRLLSESEQSYINNNNRSVGTHISNIKNDIANGKAAKVDFDSKMQSIEARISNLKKKLPSADANETKSLNTKIQKLITEKTDLQSTHPGYKNKDLMKYLDDNFKGDAKGRKKFVNELARQAIKDAKELIYSDNILADLKKGFDNGKISKAEFDEAANSRTAQITAESFDNVKKSIIDEPRAKDAEARALDDEAAIEAKAEAEVKKPDMTYGTVSNLMDEANKAIKSFMSKKGKDIGSTNSLKDIREMHSALNGHITAKEAELKTAKEDLDKMGYGDIKARKDKMEEIKMRGDELSEIRDTQSKLKDALEPVKKHYANDTIDTKNVLEEYKRITGNDATSIDEAHKYINRKKKEGEKYNAEHITGDEGTRIKTDAEKAADVESYIKKKASEKGTTYKESYAALDTKAAIDKDFAMVYNNVKGLSTRQGSDPFNKQIDAYTNYINNGYKIDAAEADMLAGLTKHGSVKSTLITTDDGLTHITSTDMYSSRAASNLFQIKDGEITVNKNAIKDIINDKFGATIGDDKVKQLVNRAAVTVRNDIDKLTKSGVSVHDVNDVLLRNYKDTLEGTPKYTDVEKKFVDSTITTAGEMPDVGPQVLFQPSKHASKYMNNESGFLQDTKIYTTDAIPGISDIAKGKRGFIDESGNIYLNNGGELNASNMLTVLHELAHQFADATGKNKLSRDESYLTAMASTVRRRLLEGNPKMFAKKMKSSEVQTDRVLDNKDAAQFEAYVVNTLNNPHSGFAKWANRSISEVYASNIGKDSVTKIKDTLSKHNTLFKSVDDFVNDLVGESPTLNGMFAYDSKRLTSIAASHKLKAVEARMQQMEAEIRSEFEKNSGNMSDKQLESMGEFINAGGYQLLDIVKVSEIADFLRGSDTSSFKKTFDPKRFEANGDELITRFISSKLNAKLEETFDIKYDKRIKELKRVIEFQNKQYSGGKGTSDITTSGSSESLEFRDKIDVEGEGGRLEQDVKNEHLTKVKEAEDELNRILQSKADQVGKLRKEITAYVKDKKLMHMEAKHIADEQFYREGISQIDGKRAIFSSTNTKDFVDGLVTTISNNKAISDLKLKPEDVRNLIDDIPLDVQTKLQRQMDGSVMSRRLRAAMENGKLDVDELGAMIQQNPKGVEYMLGSWGKVARQLESEGINTRQFGFNPANKASAKNRPLKIVPTNAEVNEDNIVHRIGKDFMVVIDEAKASLGKQEGLAIADSNTNSMKINTRDIKVSDDKLFYRHANKEDEFIGYTKDFNVNKIGQGKYEITLKNSDMINNQNAYSMNVADAYMSNIRSLIHNRIGKKANNDFVASMKEAGIIKPSFEATKGERTFRYNGVNYVVDKRYAHNIFGTKGIDVTNKYAASIVNSMQGIIGMAKSKVLTTRLKSYINNTVANNITVAFTTKMPLAKILTENDKSMKDIGRFMNIASTDGMRVARSKYPDIYEFMYKVGAHDTMMRDAVRTNGKVNQNQFIDVLAGMSNTGLENDIRSTNFMEGTKAGDTLASLFDSTEVKQKLTFYRHQKRKGLSADQAMEETMLAFPTYAENLTDVMSLADEVVLFMKYFNNIPKITRYALNKNSAGLMTMFAGMIAARESLYYVLPENGSDDWMREYGMTKVGPDTYVNISSANNYNISSMFETNTVSSDLLKNHTTGIGATPKLWSSGSGPV